MDGCLSGKTVDMGACEKLRPSEPIEGYIRLVLLGGFSVDRSKWRAQNPYKASFLDFSVEGRPSSWQNNGFLETPFLDPFAVFLS
jgi:hypothetical protein